MRARPSGRGHQQPHFRADELSRCERQNKKPPVHLLRSGRRMQNPRSQSPNQQGLAEAESSARPISRTWIVIGLFALALGLAMGLLMSSLGR
jgi:hypothetical protein